MEGLAAQIGPLKEQSQGLRHLWLISSHLRLKRALVRAKFHNRRRGGEDSHVSLGVEELPRGIRASFFLEWHRLVLYFVAGVRLVVT